jgi:hypothetical protein
LLRFSTTRGSGPALVINLTKGIAPSTVTGISAGVLLLG